jgi:hypothetical protein
MTTKDSSEQPIVVGQGLGASAVRVGLSAVQPVTRMHSLIEHAGRLGGGEQWSRRQMSEVDCVLRLQEPVVPVPLSGDSSCEEVY